MIGSLAVDVEPVVFWDGVSPTPQEVLDRWKNVIGYDEAEHGSVHVGTNGPSGASVVDHVLVPLGLDPRTVAFTDAVPWFFVKSGARSQGDAILKKFGPQAALMGVHPGSLPPRPSVDALVKIATTEPRRDELRSEIVEADAPLVITLGNEALRAVAGAVDSVSGMPRVLSPAGYGTVGEITVGGKRMSLLPLAHPGFQRLTPSGPWREAFDRWSSDRTS